MEEPTGSINGIEYPIAVSEQGDVIWRTVQVAEEKDETWDDWSEGAGETKRETGRGYLWSDGFDASSPGVLRLSPHYLAHNNTSLTTGYGYFMEGVETTGSSLVFDAASTSKASGTSLSWSHTTGSTAERALVVAVAANNDATGTFGDVTYAGTPLTFLGWGTSSGFSVRIWYLLNPPSGANTISISTTVSMAMVGGATSWSGVNQDTPFGTMTGDTQITSTTSITVTSATGEFVLDFLVANNETATVGAGQTQRWNDIQTLTRGAGSTEGGAASVVMSCTLRASARWILMGVNLKPSSITSRSLMWVGDGTNMFRYNYDTSGGPTLAGTQAIASATAIGQPAKLSTKWYAGMGNGTFAYRLDDASSDTGWVITTWKAGHLSNFQKGILPTAARSNTTSTNVVYINDISAGGNVADAWTSDSQKVGDSTTAITALVEAAGNLYVAKEDSLYEFGTEAESRNAIPFLSRGKIDSENGKGTIAFGNIVIYPSKDGMAL